MTNEIFENDSEARKKITEIDKNLFVEAGAGSGKTHSLVQRMIAMVKNGIDIRRICAITFTKAAAAEFYRRFQETLSDELSGGSLKDDKRKYVSDALENIDLCFMGTIDSFCNMLLSEHPALAGIPSDCRMLGEDERKAVYLREYSEIAKGNYGEELLTKQRKYASVVENDRKMFADNLGDIIENRHAEFVHCHPFEGTPDEHFSEQRKTALSDLLTKISDERETAVPPGSKQNPDKYVDTLDDIMSRASVLGQSWNRNHSEVRGFLSTVSDSEKFRINKDWKNAEYYTVSELLEHVKKARSEYYTILEADKMLSEYNTYLYSIVMDFLSSAAPAVARKMKERGLLTYYDYLLYLRDMLKKDAEEGGRLIEHISRRHSYYLIDEFQDTNPLQAEIFFYLAAEKPCGDWIKCRPRPGSLFVVGDPKQSIYRFRGADVASFIKVRSLFEQPDKDKPDKDMVVRLTRNFRSSKQMCGFFNKVFPGLINSREGMKNTFSEIPCEENYVCPDGTFSGVYMYECFSEYGKTKGEPEQICNIIQRLVNDPDQLIYDRKTGGPRRIRYDDFMVITPEKKMLHDITIEMNRRGIPVFTEGSVPFDECPLLRELYTIVNALGNPSDDIAVYSALTGKCLGIGEKEILGYICTGGNLRLFSSAKNSGEDNSKGNGDRVSTAVRSLRALYRQTRLLPPSAAIERISDILRLAEKVSVDNFEYFCFALEQIRAKESTAEIMSLRDAAEFLRKLISGELSKEYERCFNLESERECVHIANMHKVKGLEAEIVILADAGTYKKHAQPIRSADDDNGKRKCWIFNLSVKITDNYSESYLTDEFESEKENENTCEEDEKIRKVYVAATRAKKALIIAFHPKNNSLWKPLYDCGVDIPDIEEVLKKNNVITETELEKISAAELLDKSKDDCVLNTTHSLEKTYSLILPSQLKLKSKASITDAYEIDEPVSEADEGPADVIPESDPEETASAVPDGANAALVGTLIHRLMELMVLARKSDSFNIDDAARQIIGEYDGADESFIPMLREVGNIIKKGGYRQEGGMPADIMKELSDADEVYCEVPFCREKILEDGSAELWHGVIDLLYRKGDVWRIVDYKTDALTKNHRPQLDAYEEALLDMTGIKAKAYIYHIDK